MPSGWLAFVTRCVNLMAANMTAPFWLSVQMADYSLSPEFVGEKLDQMVV